MHLKPDSPLPLFQQIADLIADGIVSGAYKEDEQIPSTTEIAATLSINPATVLKGMNLLVSNDHIYKKRGLGMFVAPGARERLLAERRAAFYDTSLRALIEEARKIGLTRADIIKLLEENSHD